MCEPWQAQKIIEDKESFGYSLSPTPMPSAKNWSEENCQLMSSGPKDRKNLVTAATGTSRYALRSARRSLLPQLRECLEEEYMPSSPVLRPQPPTVARSSPELESLLNLDVNPFDETPKLTGSPSGLQPNPEILNPFPRISEWYLITPSERSTLIMQTLGFLIEQSRYSGDLQELVNHTVHGMKQESVLLLSALEPSSGMATRVKTMLSSMNFGAVSTLHICCDGSIVTRYVWKSKDLPDPLMLNESGSHQMLIQRHGIPSWI